MNRLKSPSANYFASALLSLVLILSAAGQEVGKAGDSESGESFSMSPVPHLRKGLDAWPKIIGPRTLAVKRVNAELSAMNRELIRSLKECDESYRDWYVATAEGPRTVANVPGVWSRKVTVTMSGPRFVSVIASGSQACSGAYPLNEQIAIVFDMTTGERLRWSSIAPKPETVGRLNDLQISRATGECKEALERSGLDFLAWPDAKRGLLMTKGYGLPHVVEACEETIGLTVAEARKLGFNEELLLDLARAHRAAASTPGKAASR